MTSKPEQRAEKEPTTTFELSPKSVIIFPRGQVSERDRIALNGAGFVVVEADDPAKVVTTLPLTRHVANDDIVSSMVEAISGNTFSGGEFGRTLIMRIKNAGKAATNA